MENDNSGEDNLPNKIWDVGYYSNINDSQLNMLASVLSEKIGNEFDYEFRINDKKILLIHIDSHFVMDEKIKNEIVESLIKKGFAIEKVEFSYYK